MKIKPLLNTFYVFDVNNKLLATLKKSNGFLKIVSSSLTVSELEEIFNNSEHNFSITA